MWAVLANNSLRKVVHAAGIALQEIENIKLFIAALRELGVTAAIGWLLVAVLIYSVAREPGTER